MHPQPVTLNTSTAMANGFLANDLIQCPMAVSANGNYYSVSSLDGQLHIWDTLSADLVADYTPSAHLSATCVRLSWAPLTSGSSTVLGSPTKRRKRLKTSDSDVQQEVNKLALVALGTANGTILLYSVSKGELHSQLSNGHSERVNDIAWYPASDSLFSCSNDKYVIEWSISKSSSKSKQILDRSVINAIAVIDSKNILTASSSIKWWNWETRQLLKTFSGHSTEVRYLKPVLFGSLEEETNLVLSSAVSDRYINAWELNDSTKSSAVANFALDDEPISLELAHTSSTSPVYILSISRSGYLYIFEHLFSSENYQSKANGVISTSPIVPKIRLQVSCTLSKGLRSRKATAAPECVQVPFLCVHLSSEVLPINSSASSKKAHNFHLMVGYGNANRPTFERISYSDCEKCYLKDGGVLERSDVNASAVPALIDESSHMKIKSNRAWKATDKTTVIGPAGIVASQPLFNNIKNGTTEANGDVHSDEEDVVMEMDAEEINNNHIKSKEKQNDQSQSTPQVAATPSKSPKKKRSGQLTLGEQLEAISEDEKAKEASKRKKRKDGSVSESADQANTESLVNVLMQGLKSKDSLMLQTVLECTDETICRNTIKKLPVSYVPLFLAQLQAGLFKNGDHQAQHLKWINMIMQLKITYLMTMSNISKEFLSLNQLLTARTAMLDRCYQLKGRLDIMLSQIKTENRTDKLTRTKPQLTYESDSSESDAEMEDEEEAEEDEEEEDALSVDDKDLLFTDSEDDDDENDDEDDNLAQDEEMYDSANEAEVEDEDD